MRFRERIARFMMGRNGPDALYTASMWTCLVLILVSFFLTEQTIPYLILSVLEATLFIWATFRFFSRNREKRYRENNRFLKGKNAFFGWFKLQKSKWRDRKTHAYRRCPHCKSVLRLPKQKGRHDVRCPRCASSFSVKI